MEIRQLRALGRRRDELLVMHVQERNRMGDDNMESVAESIESLLSSLAHELAEIEGKSNELVAGHKALKEQFALLRSIAGIGLVCAEAILSETGGFARFTRAAEVVAFAGLSPSA